MVNDKASERTEVQILINLGVERSIQSLGKDNQLLPLGSMNAQKTEYRSLYFNKKGLIYEEEWGDAMRLQMIREGKIFTWEMKRNELSKLTMTSIVGAFVRWTDEVQDGKKSK